MESGWFYPGGELCIGKVKRVKFAHHVSGKKETRDLNVHPLITRLVLGGMATYHELRTIYSLEDLYYLNEMLNLKEEAQYLADKGK